MKLLVACLFLLATPQQVGPPKSEWIVIFNHVTTDEPPPVTINIRLIVQARSEGDAVLTSMKRLRKIIDDRTCEALQYVECQERK
jgi:hypothetical protein